MSALQETVEDRVGKGGIIDVLVPVLDWELTGDEGSADADKGIER